MDALSNDSIFRCGGCGAAFRVRIILNSIACEQCASPAVEPLSGR